jgi:type I restriction enzyme, R subunit
MSGGPEYSEVEKPFLDQLELMGDWTVVAGNLDYPSETGRETFREVFIKDDIRSALRRINLRDGQAWLDDIRISQAVSALERIGSHRLIEANQIATELLLSGIAVEGVPGWDQGRSRTIHYIDWEHPENNTFTAINQFRVDCPGGFAKGFVTPDIVLFINGIPVVVVECKSPATSEPIPTAIDQLRRYSNQRKAAGEIEEDEGNERLFYTNQFLVATSYDEARIGTITADAEHYLEWKDTAPIPREQVQTELTKDILSSQNTLIAGALRPAHLLDIIRHFCLYHEASGRLIKVVCRYQQFRAVRATVDRLLCGKTRKQDGEHDLRGGIIWHTQGSGKSLSMVFLVRKMRSTPELRRFKVVVVTDRKDLQRQLSETAELSGETVEIAKRAKSVKSKLAQRGPGLLFVMLQKYGGYDSGLASGPGSSEVFPVLNDDESILVMVDEAHRSHANALHANLMRALPNAARIGFTGTPIIMGAKKRTHEIFGDFIDRYTIAQSEADGATVPILYEGRTAEGAVSDGRDLDQLFEDMFHDMTPEQLEAIRRKYATNGNVLEAPKLIEAKAKDILRHYVEFILPNGLKAQVVAYSRLAAVRYYEALRLARDELVQEAFALNKETRELDDVQLQERPRKIAAAVRAWRNVELLKRLEFAPVISPDNNDDPALSAWTDGAKIEARIGRFKKPLIDADPKRADPLAFLIVKSMLITGFDAPIEGVMYLDRPIREANLLQAIARVNRPEHGKTAGIVVDYYGVARHLKEALAAYSADDIQGALRSLQDEIPKLRDRRDRCVGLFEARGIEDIGETEACVELLKDERLRAEFTVKLKQFLDSLDLVLPRPEALPFVKDAKTLGFIYDRARNRYREGMPMLGKSVGGKVRELIDQHVISLGIDPKIPPISITDAQFAEHVGKQVSPRAKASEMEHAVRYHVKKHLQEDPVHYAKLSERLEEILRQFGDNWDQLALALRDFVEEVHAGRQDSDLGLDVKTQAPFLALLKEQRESEQPVAPSDLAWLAGLTVQLVDHIQSESAVVGFWSNPHAQEVLRSQIFTFLDDYEVVEFERADEVADRVMELSKANRHNFVKT